MTKQLWKALPIVAMLAASAILVQRPEPVFAQGKGGGGKGKGAPPAAATPAAAPKGNAKGKTGEVHSLKVQGNVYMLWDPAATRLSKSAIRAFSWWTRSMKRTRLR